MSVIRLQITGKKGSGKGEVAGYLTARYGAIRWTRSELMKRIAHAVVDQVGDLDGLLRQLFGDDDGLIRQVSHDLLAYGASYDPEPGKPRRLYQEVTDVVMNHDPEAFERELVARMRAVEKAQKGHRIFMLLDDVRAKPAFDFFASQGYQSLRINVSPAVQRQRLIARDGYIPSEATFRHPSETDMDDVKHDYVIDNSTNNRARLHAELDRVMEKLAAEAGFSLSTEA